MADVTAGMAIFSRLTMSLAKTTAGNPGMSDAAAQAFINTIIADINASPQLQSEINDLNSKSWTLDTSPTTGAGETDVNTRSILISVYPGSISDGVINTGSLTVTTLDNASDFVGVLAHELGHAEDPQLGTISYNGNGLAPAAQTALDLLSEGKAQYNDIRAAQEIFASPSKVSIAVRGDAAGINTQIADGANTLQAIIDGATSFLHETTSTTGENYLDYYWKSALSRFPPSGPAAIASVLADLNAINMNAAAGLAFAQNANGTDTMSISFNAGTIASYIATFGRYGSLSPSGTNGGQGPLNPVNPSPAGVTTEQIFNFIAGTSTEDAYNVAPGIAEDIINYASANATGLATLIDIPNIGLATRATIDPGNILNIVEANGTGISLKLDPTQNYAGYTYNISSDVNSGTNFALTPSQPADLTVLDTTTSTSIAASGVPYAGPVSGLQHAYINPATDSLNITASTPNWFLHSGSGMDGLAVSSGNNVLDGGTNSNFLTGGTGHDTFYLDDRSPDKPIFSTVVNFHSGDSVTVWGVNASDFTMLKLDSQGAAGFTGLDLLFQAPGHIDTSFVLAGYSSADLVNGKLISSFGKTADLPGLPGSEYLTVTAA